MFPHAYFPGPENAANVRTYGARGDARTATDFAWQSGTSTVTSASGAAFTSADVGKAICVRGAGAAGVIKSTTITAVASATSCTVNTTANTTVSGATGWIGTDNTSAFNAAAVAAYASQHRTVRIPAGKYLVGNLASSFFTGSNPAEEAVDWCSIAVEGDPGATAFIGSNEINMTVGRVTELISLDNTSMFEMTGTSRRFSTTTFRHLRLNGNDPGHTASGHGIWLHGNGAGNETHDLTIHDVVFEDFGGCGFRHGENNGTELSVLWKARFDRFHCANCGDDAIFSCAPSTDCQFTNFAIQKIASGKWGFHFTNCGMGTQLSFTQGHIGTNPEAGIGNYGGGIRISGSVGHSTFDNFSVEGFNGVAIELDGAQQAVFNDLVVLDIWDNDEQVALRYTNGNLVQAIFMHDPLFVSSGWKDGHPIHFDEGMPPLFLFMAYDRTYTGKWEGGGGTYSFKPILTQQVGNNLVPRFTNVQIDDFTVGGSQTAPVASGSFTTTDGKTVTVVKGIITAITS